MHSKTAIETIKDADAREQAAFDQQTEAYTQAESDTHFRDKNASRLDTNNREPFTLHTTNRFDFAEPNWNDSLTETDMWTRCGQIADTLLRLGAGTQLPRDIRNNNQVLLDFSFSERIKQHIVTLTATTETIEGACRHCFGLYDAESKTQELGNSMYVWHTLCNVMNPAPVFHAFLERAWHLNPKSPYFPDRYRDIVDEVRASEVDTRQRDQVHFANPYAQLEALNETAKKLRYALRHTTDAKEISKLANSQVRVLGAMFVLNDRLQSKHENAIQDAKARALNP